MARGSNSATTETVSEVDEELEKKGDKNKIS